jgi:futalosine hydrolase
MRPIPENILITAATEMEMKCLENIPGMMMTDGVMLFEDCKVERLITGLGSVSLVWSVMNWLKTNSKPDISLNIGIAGSFNKKYVVGDVVVPVSDCFADLGFETIESYRTVWESGLSDPDGYPFSKGELFCNSGLSKQAHGLFHLVRGITVNTVSGSEPTINSLKLKFDPDIETMEGASFYYVCNQEKIPALGLRSISNPVEPRNRDSWNVELALENLSSGLGKLLTQLFKR